MSDELVATIIATIATKAIVMAGTIVIFYTTDKVIAAIFKTIFK